MSNEPVSLVQLEEAARFDPSRLEALCRDKGEIQAESEAAEALDQINQLLIDVAPRDKPLSRARLAAKIDDLIDAADKIGMATLSTVAKDVRRCMMQGDVVAFSATMSRLHRVGERSIHALFDLEDQSL